MVCGSATAKIYQIKSGDCLWKIAQTENVTAKALYKENKNIIGENPDLIFPNQIINIPKPFKKINGKTISANHRIKKNISNTAVNPTGKINTINELSILLSSLFCLTLILIIWRYRTKFKRIAKKINQNLNIFFLKLNLLNKSSPNIKKNKIFIGTFKWQENKFYFYFYKNLPMITSFNCLAEMLMEKLRNDFNSYLEFCKPDNPELMANTLRVKINDFYQLSDREKKLLIKKTRNL